MEIARVIGTVVATRKDDTLVGKKLLLIQPLNPALMPQGKTLVMVDTAGAGIGELVLYVTGAAARIAARRSDAAIDAAVVGIVDSVEVSADWMKYNPGNGEALT